MSTTRDAEPDDDARRDAVRLGRDAVAVRRGVGLFASMRERLLEAGVVDGQQRPVARLRAKKTSQMPPRPTGPRRGPCQWMRNAPRENAGSTSQATSTKRMTTSSTAAQRERLRVAVGLAREQQQEGHDEVEEQDGDARPQPQPPRKRARYQAISSGRLPDQTIRYCEKLT